MNGTFLCKKPFANTVCTVFNKRNGLCFFELLWAIVHYNGLSTANRARLLI